jgi:hypothetical protein
MRWSSRRLAPSLVWAALFADYVSPAAPWTLAIPIAGVLILLALRRWKAAALVALLSSWVLVPMVAAATCVWDGVEGAERVYVTSPYSGIERCESERFRVVRIDLPAGEGLSAGVVRTIAEGFLAAHNHFAFRSAAREGWLACEERPRGWTILPPSEAARLAEPRLTETWRPTSSDVARAERALPDAIRTAIGSRPGPHPAAYLRQYVGVFRAGRPVLYLNAFTADLVDSATDWRARAVVIYDGGPVAFQAVFDPAAGAFDSFAFNGDG